MGLKIFLVATCLLLASCGNDNDDRDQSQIVINPASDLERKYPEPWLSCEEGVGWEDGHEFVGKIIYIVGPVAQISPPNLAAVDSVTVALGESGAPSGQFFVNFSVGDSDEVRSRVSELRIGSNLCVTGRVKMAGERPSISVSAASQFGEL